MHLYAGWIQARQELQKAEDLRVAKGESAIVPRQEPPPKPPEIEPLHRREARLTVTGWILDLFGLTLMLIARRRRESGWYIFPLFLLVGSAMAPLLL